MSADAFSRIKERHTEAELLAYEEAARERLRLAALPDADVDDYLIAITILGDIAKERVLKYATQMQQEQQRKADSWPDEIE